MHKTTHIVVLNLPVVSLRTSGTGINRLASTTWPMLPVLHKFFPFSDGNESYGGIQLWEGGF